MSYTKTNWTEETAINVDRLMNIENGLEGSYTELTEIQSEINSLQDSISRRPRAFQGAYLQSSDDNTATIRTSASAQEGLRLGAKMYAEIFDVDFPELSPGENHSFTLDIKAPDVLSMTAFNGAFINSFSRELNVSVVDWSASFSELVSIEFRSQNVSDITLSARSRRFNVLLTGY